MDGIGHCDYILWHQYTLWSKLKYFLKLTMSHHLKTLTTFYGIKWSLFFYVHKRLLLGDILKQWNPVHIPQILQAVYFTLNVMNMQVQPLYHLNVTILLAVNLVHTCWIIKLSFGDTSLLLPPPTLILLSKLWCCLNGITIPAEYFYMTGWLKGWYMLLRELRSCQIWWPRDIT